MINFSVVFAVLTVFAVLAFSRDEVLVAATEQSQIAGSGNGEIDSGSGSGSGNGELLEIALPPECTAEFKAEVNHTMCKYHDDLRVFQSGVSDRSKKIIVDLHNKFRANVKPPAKDLVKLVWDDKLAAIAQKWAKQCQIGHDKNRAVPSYGGIPIGQNAAAGYSGWRGAIKGWYNEVKYFSYGKNPESYPKKGMEIGHYTQVVQNSAYRIGCGYARCHSSTYGRYYVCNYGKGQTNLKTPYSKGKRCSSCPKSCNNGLCDCGGKLCLNGGSLDIDSCTCKCPQIYQGSKCEQLTCPSSDKQPCWRSYKPKHCSISVVANSCPFMCGLCGGPNGATPPPVFVSKYNCTYKGQRPSLDVCNTYGDSGADIKDCASRGGKFDCDSCTKYSNVKTEFCPVMCGVCDGPCNGKNCYNRGKLNRETCTCSCPSPYAGEICEKINCPKSDKSYCGSQIKPADCKQFINAPNMCPLMCGLCGKGGAPCDGKVCMNQGKLDTNTCQCMCREPFSGAICDTETCPESDKWQCQFFDGISCQEYSNLPTDCPHMCGLCSKK